MELSILTPDKIKEIFKDCLNEFFQEKQFQKDSGEDISTAPMNSKELCEHLNISLQTLNTYRKKKKIPFFRVGSSIRYDLNKVLKALNK